MFLMYLYGTPSASNLGAYRRPRALGAHRRSPKRLRGLGINWEEILFPVSSLVQPISELDASSPIPGSTAGDDLYNMSYGNVSPNQNTSLVAQEQASLVQAGMDPAAAAAQAQSDVTDTLSTYTGPGALNVNWTGAAPNQPGFPTAAASAAGSAIANTLSPTLSAIPTWIWWVVGGLGIFVAYKIVKDVF
jgi:hypothetical protein